MTQMIKGSRYPAYNFHIYRTINHITLSINHKTTFLEGNFWWKWIGLLLKKKKKKLNDCAFNSIHKE